MSRNRQRMISCPEIEIIGGNFGAKVVAEYRWPLLLWAFPEQIVAELDLRVKTKLGLSRQREGRADWNQVARRPYQPKPGL
jgi:hypothetical protein